MCYKVKWVLLWPDCLPLKLLSKQSVKKNGILIRHSHFVVMFPCENVEKCSPTTSPSWFPGTGGIIKFHIQANVGSYAYKCDYHFELKIKFTSLWKKKRKMIKKSIWLQIRKSLWPSWGLRLCRHLGFWVTWLPVVWRHFLSAILVF